MTTKKNSSKRSLLGHMSRMLVTYLISFEGIKKGLKAIYETLLKTSLFDIYSFGVQQLSHVLSFLTPQTAAHQASVSITNTWSLLKLMYI